jgi:2-methylcitrate dehydratase PrpD
VDELGIREVRGRMLRTGLHDLGRFTAALSWLDQSSEVREAVLRVLVDSFSVMIAGGRLSEMARLRDRLPVSQGPSSVFGGERTAGVLDAAWLNGTALVSLELDEGNKRVRGHATAHVLPAVVALGESRAVRGSEFAAAFLAGHEVASRFGSAVVLHQGVHPHGNWGVTGAAAGAARIMGLDAASIAASIDISAALALITPFRVATAGMGVRNAWIGHANVAGIQAAALAQEGEPLVGIADESFGQMVGALSPAELSLDLGSEYFITGGYFKRHASCSYTHPPADVALAVFSEFGSVDSDAVDTIEIRTHHLASNLQSYEWPTRLAAMFSIPYVVAVALLDGKCWPESFDEAKRTDLRIADLAKKVSVNMDESLDARLPEFRAARICIRWKNGGESVVESENPIGDSDFHPLSDEDLLAKSTMLLGDRDQALAVRALCHELIDSTDVSLILGEIRMVALPRDSYAR